MKEEENRIREQIAIKGGIKKLKNLTFLFNPNLNFLGILVNISVFFIITFEDSFNWSKQFMVSESKEFPIFKINGFTFGLELLRTILCIWRFSAFMSINLDSYNGILFFIKRFE